MSVVSKEVRFGEYPSSRVYDPNQVYLSDLMFSKNGATATDRWAGPLPIAVARPMEQSTAVAMAYPNVIRRNDNTFWVFLAENTTAAANRRVFMYEYLRNTAEFNWKGFITLTLATNQTVRGLRAARYLYTTGTIACNSTTVAGAGTSWTTDTQAVGARIGFGSTDPEAITTWYPITAIPSNVQITLGSSAGAIASGTAYVIDELRIILATTAATALSGGLYIAKGLNEDVFSGVGTTIPAATTVDNIRATYFLADQVSPAAQLTTTAAGLGLGDFQTWQSHSVYLLAIPAATTPRMHHFNMRAGLTLTNGRAANALITQTGLQTVTGNVSQANNGRTAVLAHGPGSGSDCFYFVSTTRILRSPLTSLTSGSTTWVVDQMTEVPPGSTTTFAVGGALNAVEHAGSIDRLLVTSTGAAGIRSYVTKYNTVGAQMDDIVFVDTKQLDQASGQGPMHINIAASPLSIWMEDGLAFVTRNTTAVATNQLFASPMGADLEYIDATGDCLISPKIITTGCTSFRRVYVNHASSVGTGALKLSTEAFVVQVRTGGIDDNSGTWIDTDETGDLGFLGASAEIQFRFLFNVMTGIGIPAKIYGLSVTYESDPDILPEFEWNLNDSNTSTGAVGFSQHALLSASVPNLQIDYYRSDTSALVLSQVSTGATNGNFQWFSGSVWTSSLAPNGLGPNTIGTRRRFVPTAGLPASINVYTKITSV